MGFVVMNGFDIMYLRNYLHSAYQIILWSISTTWNIMNVVYWIWMGFMVMNGIDLIHFRNYLHQYQSTVWCCYNAVSFHPNSHKRHPLARLLGQGMGCLFWYNLWCIFIICLSHCHTIHKIMICWTTLQWHSTVACIQHKVHEILWMLHIGMWMGFMVMEVIDLIHFRNYLYSLCQNNYSVSATWNIMIVEYWNKYKTIYM